MEELQKLKINNFKVIPRSQISPLATPGIMRSSPGKRINLAIKPSSRDNTTEEEEVVVVVVFFFDLAKCSFCFALKSSSICITTSP